MGTLDHMVMLIADYLPSVWTSNHIHNPSIKPIYTSTQFVAK